MQYPGGGEALKVLVDDLRGVGLIDNDPAHPHLTEKGRDWLRSLEDIDTQEVVDANEAAVDLILSSHGLLR